MTIDWMALTNLGFPIVFGVFVLWSVSKYGPIFIKAWSDFTMAIQRLSSSVDENTQVTRRQYEESMSVKEQLKNLNDKLAGRDIKFDKAAQDHAEIMRLLHEIEKKLESFWEG